MLKRILNSKLLFIFIVGFLVFGSLKKSISYFGLEQSKSQEPYPIVSDGSGYYAFLPQWFIYKTDNFEFIDSIQKKYPDARFYEGITNYPKSNKKFNRYFVGTAVLQAPGFLITHLIAFIFHLDNDGYSTTYQLYTVFSAFLFAFIGFWSISKILSYYKVARFTKLVTILAIAFGTNLENYVLYNSSFSHVYSFAIISLFVLSLYRWRASHNNVKHLPIIALLLGFVFIIRPTDAIIAILIPFFFSSKENLFLFFKRIITPKAFIYLLLSIIIFFSLLSLQLLSTYQQLGIWKLNIYVGENFEYLMNPKFIEVLFSFRKGLFIYAPILIISLFGFYTLWKKDKSIAIGSISALILFTYITASWWCWWYGGGLGMRPYINVLVLFAIPFGLLYEEVSNGLKIIILLFSSVFIFMYQIYQYQMENNIIHYDNMDYTKFKQVFLKTDIRFGWSLHREFDSLPTQKADKILIEHIRNKDVIRYNMDHPEKTLNVHVIIDTNYTKWAGSISGKVKIITEEQNPNFTVRYFMKNSLVKENEFIFGGEIPKLNNYYPIQINFNPDLSTSSFDKVEISFFAAGYECYFKDAHFTSYYYSKK